MALSWSARRKITYSGTIFFIAFIIVAFVWHSIFSIAPTCFDHMQNGGEAGVDCGGSCSLQCEGATSAPQVLWSRVFQNGNFYTAAAYIQNNNGEIGAHGVHYAFQLFDVDNKLVVEKDGVMDIPPVQTIPVVEQNISVGNRIPIRAIFSFTEDPIWQKVPHGSVPNIKIINQTLSPDSKRVDTTIGNDLLQDLSTVGVVAVLFDSKGVARAASKSTLPLLDAKSRKTITFTWPQSIPDVAHVEISALPSF